MALKISILGKVHDINCKPLKCSNLFVATDIQLFFVQERQISPISLNARHLIIGDICGHW